MEFQIDGTDRLLQLRVILVIVNYAAALMMLRRNILREY